MKKSKKLIEAILYSLSNKNTHGIPVIRIKIKKGWYRGLFTPVYYSFILLKKEIEMELKKEQACIYLFAGKAQQGKDTSALLVKEYYESVGKKIINLQYSSYIKSYAKVISDWDGSEETKPRELLQILGTEVIRNNIDKDFFCKRIVEDIKIYSFFYDVITISDIRYPNEIEYPKNNFKNCYSILVTRPAFDNKLSDNQKLHPTETALDNYHNFDYRIINDGSLEDLNVKVLSLIKETEK